MVTVSSGEECGSSSVRRIATSDIIHGLRYVLPPSRPLGLLAGVAFAAEAFLISVKRPNIYTTDRYTLIFGLVFLAWFWLTVAWVLDRVGRVWRRQFERADRSGRLLLTIALALGLATAFLAYATSWGLFFRSGRFANLETGRFVLFNVKHLWSYLVAAEPSQLMLGGLVLSAAFAGLPGLLYWSVAPQRSDAERATRRSVVAWMIVSGITLLTWNAVPGEESVLRRADRLHALKYGLNPSFSLYISHLEATLKGHITPDLAVEKLTPLRTQQAADLPSAGDGTAPPSIIFVAVESLRHDMIYRRHQNQEILPHVNRLARAGLQLTKAYAESTHSDYADVCLVSSLYPLRTLRHHYYTPSDPWPKTLIYDLLKPRGYATAIISSQNEAWGGMDHFLASDQLDLFYHPETSDAATMVSDLDPGFSREVRLGSLVAGKFPDAHTTGQAIAWVRAQVAAGRPFFLSMNLQSSHFPYLMPDDVPRPFQPCRLDPHISFVEYPIEQVETVRHAYYNAIHECDRQIGRLVAALEELGQLENTILVVTGENGESFHECQSVTHARDPVEPAIHIAWVIHAPGRITPRVDDYPCEHVDLVPTVLALAGMPSHPNFQGRDLLADDREPAEQRLTFCHVLSSLAEADAVTLGGRWKLTHDRRSDRLTLFDVEHDPGEQHNLISSEPELSARLQWALATWRQQQLAYYHYPAYYLSYYPPAPPRWDDTQHALGDVH